MAITVNVQVEVQTVGDGVARDDVFNWPTNSTAPRSPSGITVNSNSPATVTVPATAKGFILVAPTTAGTYTLKGVSGDTGVPITAGGLVACRFPSAGSVSSFVLTGTVSGIWTVIWA